jgi:tetratricopeptide (TPR) repeat protein
MAPPTVPAAAPSNAAADANRLYKQGRDLAEQENFEQARQLFDQALRIDPALTLAFNARGYAYLRLRKYSSAIDDFSKAIRLNPNYANAYRNRSVAKRAMGDEEGARDDLHRATELEGVAQASIARLPSRP